MKELLKKLGTFSLGPVIGAFLGFVTIPVITNFIDAAEYGRSSMFLVAQSTLSIFLYMGLDQAFVREYHIIEDDKDRLLTNAMVIPFGCLIIIEVGILTNLHGISELLFKSRNEIDLVLALALLLPFMIVENFALLKIRMEEKGLEYSFFTILLKALVLILTISFFFLYEKSYRSVIYAMALAEVINGIALYLFCIRKVKFSLKYMDKPLLGRMLKFGLPLVPASMIGWILGSMDKIMLRTLSSFTELGLYASAYKIVTILGIVQTCFTLFWTPVSYRWFESKKDNIHFTNIGKIVSTIMTLLCLGLLLFKDVVGLVLGKSFHEAIFIFPFLLLFPIMYTMSEVTAVGIGFMRKTEYNIGISAIAALVNMGLNYYMIPIYGGKGAAIATGISYMVFFWIRTLASRRVWYKFKLSGYVIYTIIIAANCGFHTFFQGIIPYLISIASIVILGMINIKDIKAAAYYVRNINKGEGEETL